jgi:hypothetical protein
VTATQLTLETIEQSLSEGAQQTEVHVWSRGACAGRRSSRGRKTGAKE